MHCHRKCIPPDVFLTKKVIHMVHERAIMVHVRRNEYVRLGHNRWEPFRIEHLVQLLLLLLRYVCQIINVEAHAHRIHSALRLHPMLGLVLQVVNMCIILGEVLYR